MAEQSTIIINRLTDLRKAMKKKSIAAVIIPSSDPHLSEYLTGYWKCREWLSGFTGSAGTLVVTQTQASLWTDSRYWEQATKQLSGTSIQMCKITTRKGVPYLNWIIENTHQSDVIGINGFLVSLAEGESLKEAFKKADRKLKFNVDFIKKIWKDRPELPQNKIYKHDEKYVGQSCIDKLTLVRSEMKEQGAQWLFISTLDDIAWVLNLRGSDIDYTPVFMSYLLIGKEKAILAINKNKITDEIQVALEKNNISIIDYENVTSLRNYIDSKHSLLLDENAVSYAICEKFSKHCRLIKGINPTEIFKSLKNEQQIACLREVMAIDGAAFCNFQCWFDKEIKKRSQITEIDVSEKIEFYRMRYSGYISPSFATIAGFNENAALPHYQATKTAFSKINKSGVLLIDTGGQYYGGTTDMTRVVAVGKPTKAQKEDFTVVLKSAIALSSASFPRLIPACLIDSIARNPLWSRGLDYGHGTGHGVGYFLNVHEGPQGISYKGNPEPVLGMEVGMVTSIEPGLYRPGKWGIRIENLAVNQKTVESEFGEFLSFEILTVCPIDTRCIEVSLLTAEEINWLNQYHRVVREKLLPLVDEDTKNWLLARTEPIGL